MCLRGGMESILIYNKDLERGVDIDIIGHRLIVDYVTEDDFIRP